MGMVSAALHLSRRNVKFAIETQTNDQGKEYMVLHIKDDENVETTPIFISEKQLAELCVTIQSFFLNRLTTKLLDEIEFKKTERSTLGI